MFTLRIYPKGIRKNEDLLIYYTQTHNHHSGAIIIIIALNSRYILREISCLYVSRVLYLTYRYNIDR